MQLEIMEHCAVLSPDFFNPKDIVGMSMELELFLKNNPEATGEGKSALDVIADFLRGDDITVAGDIDPEPDDDNGGAITRVI